MRTRGKILTGIITVALFCILFAVNVFAGDDVAIDATNFPDENFRKYVGDNFDKNADGILQSSEADKLKIDDLIPNPIIIKVKDNNEKLTEYALKQAILNNLDEFLLQLGSGFSYIGNEYKIKLGSVYNYIDFIP